MTEISITKFEEKIARRLGEVAILLYLARSKEGSHAYEIRTKASEILFEKRRKGMKFIHNHLEILQDIKDLTKIVKIESEEYENNQKLLIERLNRCPVLRYNPHFENLIYRKKEENFDTDLQYLDSIVKELEDAIHNIKDYSTIWSNLSGIYPAIDSLERSRLIEYVREDSEGGRLRKIYKITDLGRKTLGRVILSLAELTGFVFHAKDRKLLFSKESDESLIFNPFRKVFKKLSEDVSPKHRKQMMIIDKNDSKMHFTKMFMEHGLPLPSFRFLIRHPAVIKDHLDQLESEEERELAKRFLRKKINERKGKLEEILQELN